MSGLRSRELRDIAKSDSLQLRDLPKLFEVRWSEFNSSLLESVLLSWRALVNYFKTGTDQSSQGYYEFLTAIQNVQLLAFLGDLLFVFTRYHKKMQDDKFNLTDLPEWKADCLKRLDLLDQSRVVGGWEAAFYKDFDQEKNIFHGEQLNEKNRNPRRNEHHRYVSESSRSFPAVRYEILESLKNFIKERLSYDEMLSSMLKKLISFRSNDNELVNVHEKIAADLSLPCLSEEYIDAKNIPALKSLSLLESAEYFSRMKEFGTLCTVYARIAACSAHSAGVERVISLYNQLKTADRSSLSNETLAHNL